MINLFLREEMEETLDYIKDLYTSKDINHQKLSSLWNKYYMYSAATGIKLDNAYDLYLLGENVSYILDCDLNYNDDLLKPVEVIEKVNESNPLTMEEANILLRWVVNDTWHTLEKLGLDLSRNSLCGYCDFGQLNSIYPLEKLGFPVTKNTTETCFDTYFHHAFGTVTMNILEDEKVVPKTFLIDTTYKQFFTTVRCNNGRYFTKNEDYDVDASPDCGFFMKTDFEKEVASKLITNGYILLTNDVAKIYGDGFKKSSIPLSNTYLFDNFVNTGSDYINNIISKAGDYSMDKSDFVEKDFTLDCCELKDKIML